MQVKFNDTVPVSRGGKESRTEGQFLINVEKCEDGIQDISIYSSMGYPGGVVRFKTVEEWDKLKNAMDRLIMKSQEYKI